MSLPISNPPIGGPVIDPFTSPLPPEDLFGPNQTQDTTGSDNPALNQIIQIPGGNTIVLTSSDITIGQYADAVQLSINGSKQGIRLGILTDLLVNAKIGVTKGDIAQALAAIRAEIAAIQQQQQAIFDRQTSEINTLNSTITALNNAVQSYQFSDQAQLATMNQAIQDYNNGAIDADQFNAIATQYNDYVTSRNAALQPFIDDYTQAVTAFQAQVDENNALIAILNAASASFGIPPIPLQPQVVGSSSQTLLPLQPLAPLPLPVPFINPAQTVPLVPPITPPPLNANDFLTTYYQPIAQILLIALSLSNRRQDVQNAFTDFLAFTAPGKNATTPPSVLDDTPTFFLTNSAGRTSGAIGLASLSSGFDNPATNGVIAAAILEADLKQFDMQFTLNALSHLALFGIQLITNGGLQAALPALRFLGVNALTSIKALNAFGIAFGIANAQIIAQEVSSGNIKQFVQQKLLQEGGIADQRTTEFINAKVNLLLLQTTLFTSSVSLGTPGLVGQVLGNVEGIPTSTLTTPPTIDQAARDTLRQIFLKDTLTSQLIKSNAIQNQNEAQQVINDAVNNVLLKSIRNSQDFNQALVKQLTLAGIAQSIAQTIGRISAQLLAEETKAQAILNEALLNKSKAQQVIAAFLARDAQISYQTAQDLARKAVEQAFKNNLITNTAEFKYALRNELIRSGINKSLIDKTLSRSIAELNAQNPVASPLLNPILAGVLSPIELENALHGFVQNQLNGLTDSERTRQIANSAAAAFVGAPGGTKPSLLSLINENAKTIQRLGGQHGIDHLAQSFRNYLSPDIDLLVFSRKVMDPAYNLFFSASTGIMYAGKPHPSNFKQELDIRI